MLKYTHWFWDFDGTLYDTYPRIVRAFQKALRQKEIDLPDEEVFIRVKQKLDTAAASVADGKYTQELMDLYHHYAEDEGEETLQPYPGLEEVLTFINHHGGHNYLYTHRGLSGPDAMKRDNLWGLFADGVTSVDGFPSKPAPDALQHLMKKHQLNPADCVMVGDRPIDLDAGTNAGMDHILFDADMAYANYPAQYRFTGFKEMLKALGAGEI